MTLSLFGQPEAQLSQSLIKDFAQKFRAKYYSDNDFRSIFLFNYERTNSNYDFKTVNNQIDKLSTDNESREVIFKVLFDMSLYFASGNYAQFLHKIISDLNLNPPNADHLETYILKKYREQRTVVIKKSENEHKSQENDKVRNYALLTDFIYKTKNMVYSLQDSLPEKYKETDKIIIDKLKTVLKGETSLNFTIEVIMDRRFGGLYSTTYEYGGSIEQSLKGKIENSLNEVTVPTYFVKPFFSDEEIELSVEGVFIYKILANGSNCTVTSINTN